MFFSHTNHAHNIHVLSRTCSCTEKYGHFYETYLRNHAKRVLLLTGRGGLNKITRKLLLSGTECGSADIEAGRGGGYVRKVTFLCNSEASSFCTVREDWILRGPRSSSFWVPRYLSNHMDSQTRTRLKSIEMTGRTDTLPWWAGGRGKDDRNKISKDDMSCNPL